MSEQVIPYFRRMQMIKLGLLPPEAVAKTKKPLKKVSDKRAKEDADKKALGGDGDKIKLALEIWFKNIQLEHFGVHGGMCMECGEWIPLNYARHATAHLLPKNLFKSVATHPLNYLILGAGCGCHQKTDRVDKFVTMKVWPEAAQRIKEMIPLLPFDELKYLSGQLMTALENT